MRSHFSGLAMPRPRGSTWLCPHPLIVLAALGFVALGACARPSPAAEEPANASAVAEPRAEPRPADSDSTDLSRLAPDVRTCLSTNARELGRGKAFYEVTRADGALGTFVYVAIADPADRATEIKPSLLLVKPDGSCVSLLDYENVFYTVDEAAPDDVQPQLDAAFSRWTEDWRAGD